MHTRSMVSQPMLSYTRGVFKRTDIATREPGSKTNADYGREILIKLFFMSKSYVTFVTCKFFFFPKDKYACFIRVRNVDNFLLVLVKI